MGESIQGFDILVNTVGPFYLYAAHVLQACIKSAVHYVDVCDDYDAAKLLLTYNDACREAGITAITGCGVSPGVTNMLSLLGAEMLDEVEEIHISWVENVADAGGEGVWWHGIHMCHGDVPQYIDGDWQEVPALSSTVEVDFMNPLGQFPVHFVGHPEPITLPKYIPSVSTVTNRGNVWPDDLENIIKPFVELGLTSTDAILVNGEEVVMRDFVANYLRMMSSLDSDDGAESSDEINFILKVEVIGKKDGQHVTFTFDGQMDDTNEVSGISAATGAYLIGSNEATKRGVFAPEGILPPKQFFNLLAERNLVYEMKKTSYQSVENIQQIL